MSQRQPRSDGFGIVRPAGPDEMQVVDPGGFSRYDLLLGAIPLVLLTAWIVGALSGVPIWATLAAGALLALPLLADALAVNPPA